MLKRFSFLVLFSLFSCTNAFSANEGTPLAPMLKKAMPAVVNIKASGKLPPTVYLEKSEANNEDAEDKEDIASKPPVEKPFTSLGSGVIVDAKAGYILTNAHVVKNADQIVITLGNDQHYNAKKIGEDPPSDIALLQIKAPNLSELTLTNSNDVEIGNPVVAIGNPFGLSQSVTSGIVSALGRAELALESYENFIQIDAPINPGNSGGALVNLKGEMIGMNTAILSPNGLGNVGIGFAIPSNMLKEVYGQLLKYGKVERGVVGVVVQTLKPNLANALNVKNISGAVITAILPNSSAEQAGLKPGDIITQVNGVEVKTNSQVVNAVGFMRTNSKATLTIWRKGKTQEVKVTIMDPDEQMALVQKENPYLYGMGLQEFNQYNPLFGNMHGLGIVGILADSNAWSAGLQQGDVIVDANGKPVHTVDDFIAVAKQSKEGMVLHVFREQNAAYIVLDPPVEIEKTSNGKK